MLAELAGWLEARDVHAVFETETAALVGLPPGRPTELARRAAARRAIWSSSSAATARSSAWPTASRRPASTCPILGVNFGSLGFLTEITLPELYDRSKRCSTARRSIDERMMLRARTLAPECRLSPIASRSTTS